MATDKPRFSVTFTDDSFKKIREFQKENNISTQSKAVAQLVEIAISEIESEIDVTAVKTTQAGFDSELSPTEKTHMKKYRSLDQYGKEAVDGVLDVEYRRCDKGQRACDAKKIKDSRQRMEVAAEPTVEIMYFSVPYQLHPMSAGTGTESDEEYTENLRLIKEPPYGTSYVARVSGDSMEPTYNNGDLVFVHSTVEIREGQVGVFLMDGQQWIKEMGDGVLISHNDEYEPRRMTPDVRCQGRVLGVCDDSYLEK